MYIQVVFVVYIPFTWTAQHFELKHSFQKNIVCIALIDRLRQLGWDGMCHVLFQILAGMPPRPQLTRDQRNFVLLEYAKKKGGKKFFQGLFAAFQIKFPGARVPDETTVRRLYKKQSENGTVNNCNSKSSPGASYSGRRRSGRSPQNIAGAKAVMDRDATKRLGDATVSPVSSARRNVLAVTKSTWSRIKLELR